VGAKEWVIANFLEDIEIFGVLTVPEVCDEGEVGRKGVKGMGDEAEG
jgi:hypothetical protein